MLNDDYHVKGWIDRPDAGMAADDKKMAAV